MTDIDPTFERQDTVEMILCEAEYSPHDDTFRVSAWMMERLRNYHHQVTGRMIKVAGLGLGKEGVRDE
jgi:hypothetical protein